MLSVVRILFTHLVLEVTSFVVYLLSYLLSEAIPSLRDSLIYLVLEAESFIQHKLKYHALESISSAWKLFSNLALEAKSYVQDLVKKSKWSARPSCFWY